jgi:peptidoglycan/LPS O-acetylase OafA/YrhL
MFFLPLIPLLLIFGRKLYGQEPFSYLAVICLLSFLEGITIAYSPVQPDLAILHKIFAILLFLLLIQAFRGSLGTKAQYGLSILLAALVSGLLTYWSVTHWDTDSPGADILLNLVLAAVLAVSGFVIVNDSELRIFRSPLFWIGAGTLFYMIISGLVQEIAEWCQPQVPMQYGEKKLFLNIADGVRYLFYIIAVLCFPTDAKEKNDAI